MKRSRVRSLAGPPSGLAVLTAVSVLALAAFGTGCGPGFRSARVQVRPSSQDDAAADPRLLAQAFALAVPEDAIVRVIAPGATCSGTLIEDDLLLTAHHCVVERGSKGEFTKKSLDAGLLRVELGGDYFAWGEVGVRAVVTPPCGEGGGAGDMAVLVLSRKLVGVATMTPRLEAPPRIGEDVAPVGFGRCALSPDGIRRKERSGGAIRALTSETMHLDAAVCPGDSGGPVLVQGSREVVGVVSLSAMDHDEHTRGASVIARLDAYRPVFAHAKLIADGQSPSELPPLACAESDAPVNGPRARR